MITSSPRASRNAVRIAAPFPWFAACRNARTRSPSARACIRCQASSVDPSSTRITSRDTSTASTASRTRSIVVPSFSAGMSTDRYGWFGITSIVSPSERARDRRRLHLHLGVLAPPGARSAQTFAQFYRRLPLQNTSRPGDVPTTLPGIVDGERMMLHGTVAVTELTDHDCQLADRQLVRVAQVHRIGAPGREQTLDAVDQVVNVTEPARLRSIAVNGERIPCERLRDELRDGSAVVSAHARTVRVE